MLVSLQSRGSVAAGLDVSAAASLLISLVEGMMARRTVMDADGDSAALAGPLERMLSALMADERQKQSERSSSC